MHDLEKQLEELEAILLDMDGVVYLEDSLIEGSNQAIESLRGRGKSIIFLTNNSTKTRDEYIEKLSNLGISAEKSEIMTAAYATSIYLSKNFEKATCYPVGEDGLIKELKTAGIEIVSRNRVEEATHVVAGMDRNLTYDKIWGALTAIRSGADFIATNPDPTFPTREGVEPGAGATIGAISGTTEKEPSIIVGKPHPYMIKESLEILETSPEKTAIIGDRITTDIMAGNRTDLTTILVLTGVSSREDVEDISNEEKKPDYIINSLKKISN